MWPKAWIQKKRLINKISSRDFSGGTVVKNLPANAGESGSNLGLGRSHMPRSSWAHVPLVSLRSRALEPQLLSPRATATEPMQRNYWSPRALEPACRNYWSPCALGPACRDYWSPRSATREATTVRSPCAATKCSPHSPQLEKACAQQRRPNAAKKKFIKIQNFCLLKGWKEKL